MKNIVEIAADGKQFNTLVTAVKAAGLDDTLAGPGPFTLFAPTDDAFAKLPAGIIDDLLNDLPKLKGVLAYHVVPGKVMAREVVGIQKAKTAQGGELRVDSAHGVKINNAHVTQADIEASNGVIHVIDAVLIPA